VKLDIDKDWFEKIAAREGDLEIGVGRRRRFPPAYGSCRCACHRSDLMHATACCHPDDDDPETRRLCREIERLHRGRADRR
jgi:hypothetical protein